MMNHKINMAFIEKMMEAKQLEKEALMMFLPENMKGHLEVIGKEVKAMMKECILEMVSDHGTDSGGDGQSPSNNKVKKVDIG